MISHVDSWIENLQWFDHYLTTPISQDDKTGDILRLFVGFTNYGKYKQYTYVFKLFDENGNEISDFLETKQEVKPHIPKEILNKKILITIIKQMTKKLLDKIQPDLIFRQTVEPLSGDSLIRYQEITDIMINDYGYELISQTTTDEGITVWKLKKNSNSSVNEDMDNEYDLSHQYTLNERRNIEWRPSFHLLKNL